MNRDLEFERSLKITRASRIIHKKLFPMIIRQAFVADGHLWIVGLHHGYLLHEYDWKTGKIQQSLLPLQHLVHALKNRGVEKQKIKMLLNSERPLVINPSDSMSQEAFQKQVRNDIRQATGQTYRRAYLSALRALPTAFQYQIAPLKNRLFMIIRNPLTVAVWSFPQGKLLNLRRLQEQEIPSEILQANQIYLGPAAASPAGFRVWFETDGPLTYQYLLLNNQYLAKNSARRWRPEKKGPLKPSSGSSTDTTFSTFL